MKEKVWDSDYFYGVKIPEWDKERGYISYETLSKAFDLVLCNGIFEAENVDSFILENGEDEKNGDYLDIFQYYIISDEGADILKEWTDEIVYYNSYLDIYVWGVDHWGTSWTIVPTNIKLVNDSIKGGDQ